MLEIIHNERQQKSKRRAHPHTEQRNNLLELEESEHRHRGGVLWLGASHVLPARLAVCSELFQMVTGSGPSTWQVPSVSSFLDISALGI